MKRLGVAALLCAVVGSAFLWSPRGKGPVVPVPAASAPPLAVAAPQESAAPAPDSPPPFAVPESLKEVFSRPRTSPSKKALEALRALADSPARPEEQEALRWLLRKKEGSNVLRNEAAKALLSWNPSWLAADLVQMMKDGGQSDVWRTYCVQYLETAFRDHGEKAALEGVRAGEASENIPVRCQSVFSMASLASDLQWEKADPQEFQGLAAEAKKCAASSDPRLVVCGLRAAARAQIREMVGVAESLAGDEKQPIEIRAAAVQALGKVGRPESLAVLEKCAKAKDGWVVQCARSSQKLLAAGRKE